jgi:flagellar biogenesis protein FliO
MSKNLASILLETVLVLSLLAVAIYFGYWILRRYSASFNLLFFNSDRLLNIGKRSVPGLIKYLVLGGRNDPSIYETKGLPV